MLVRLAWGNVRRSLRDFAVYFVTLVLGVAVFYAFNAVTDQAGYFERDATRSMVEGLGFIIRYVTVLLAVVLGLLMVYANNYLVRRRKRELGLYQVLGMRPGRVGRILTLETLLASAASLVVGLALGALMSWVLLFVSAALFQDHVRGFAFSLSPAAAGLTVGCFACIFVVMMLLNAVTLRRTRLVGLLRAERANEAVRVRSLPLMAALFVAGVGLVAASYVRLLRDGLPITGVGGDEGAFLLTTCMVIAGTVLVFFSLAGFAVRGAQMARGFYWRDLNAFTVRELAAKVNTTCASMAAISMVLFLAITSVTGGLSICATLMGSVRDHAPYDLSVSVAYYNDNDLASFGVDPDGGKTWRDGTRFVYGVPTEPIDLVGALRANGIDLAGLTSARAQADTYRPAAADAGLLTITGLARAAGISGMSIAGEVVENLESSSPVLLMGITAYNGLRDLQGLEPVELASDECFFTVDLGTQMVAFFERVAESGVTLAVGGRELHVAGPGVESGKAGVVANSPMGSNPGTLVVPDEVARTGTPYASMLDANIAEGAQGDPMLASLGGWVRIEQGGRTVGYVSTAATADEMYEIANGTSGMVSYLAIYIGFVLVIACAAILAIQQLSGASDATPRFRLLSELGCPERLMYASLRRQMCVYFLAPLVVALSHSVVALRVVTDVVALFGHLDVTAPALLTGALFVVAYGAYLVVTYLVSRGVVRAALYHGVRRD